MIKELPQARLRVKHRRLAISSWLPFFRFFVTLALISALIVGATRFFSNPEGAEALEFTSRVVHTTGGHVGILDEAVADMDGDGDMDIVTAGTGGVRVYEQTTKGKFSPREIDDDSAHRVELGDFNGDGDKDLLISLKNNPGVRWYRNEGGLDFEGFDVVGVGTPGLADSGDIDQDGDDDIVTANNEGGIVNLRRWMNDGSGSFTQTLLQSDSKTTAVTIGDVNGNGYPDAVVAGTDGLQRWGSSNGTTFSRIDIDSDNPNKSWIALEDVTGDDKIDIVTGDQNKDFVALYKNLDNSAWQRNLLDIDADAGRVVLEDFEGDGDMDMIVTSQDESTIYWLDNDGTTNFTQRTIATALQSVLGVAIADVDKDGDLDFVAADHFRGTLFWFERVRAKPVAAAPTNIQQSSSGSGLITFDVSVSDGDLDPTRLRIEYSVDSGKTFHKAAIHAVKVSAGSVDLNNDVGYQIGTKNAIDTNTNDSVKVTVTWDPKSVQNLGGPLVGDIGTVVLRATARDNVSQGLATTSSVFRVDNKAPQGLTNFRVASVGPDSMQLAWAHPVDSSSFTYTIFYGTDATKVNDRTSDSWTSDDDENLNDTEATNTTITDLELDKTYTFKLVVKDQFGNETSSPAVQGTTSEVVPTPLVPTPTHADGVSPTPVPTSSTGDPVVTSRPTPPPTTFGNEAPVADAGSDQAVNPNTLVILDGTASVDIEGEALVFVWRQLSGPTVELLSSRTATPSFSAGDDGETYIFSLMVRDPKGASSTDIVTVATKSLPSSSTVPVTSTAPNANQTPTAVAQPISATQMFFRGLDLLLLAFAFVATSISGLDRLTRSLREGPVAGSSSLAEDSPKGRVVHYRTGEPIVGATVLVYSQDGKLKSSERTNAKGEFTTIFPVGSYTIVVQSIGFAFAPMTAGIVRPDAGILYTGGPLSVRDGSRPISLTIPMKPTAEEVGTWRTRILHLWQTIQHWGRMLSWPVFLMGAGLNTVLIFLVPNVMYLVIEVLYVILVIIKVALEVRVRPAYGMVRDAITHVPLDLAVVRLYEQGTNRLVMTRVTNNQGRFFALPPAGTYTVTVTKPGYGLFTKEGVLIATDQDSALQITTDLMPVVPQAGMAALRSAVL